MSFTKNSSPGYLANHLARLFAIGLQRRIDHLGITTGQFPALLALFEKDGQTQRELIGQIDVEQATLANTLGRMERDGLIIREDHPTDGRAKVIRLTERARGLRAAAAEAAMAQNKLALSGLSEAERQTFVELMQRVIDTMKENQAEGE